MYACMYVCMYACMHVCIALHCIACMYVCTYACMYMCMQESHVLQAFRDRQEVVNSSAKDRKGMSIALSAGYADAPATPEMTFRAQ